MAKGKSKKGVRFRSNTADPKERLFNKQSDVVNQLNSARRGMPIALSKARTEYDRAKIKQTYNKKINELKKQANELQRQLSDAVMSKKG